MRILIVIFIVAVIIAAGALTGLRMRYKLLRMECSQGCGHVYDLHLGDEVTDCQEIIEHLTKFCPMAGATWD
jgi:rubredoxin